MHWPQELGKRILNGLRPLSFVFDILISPLTLLAVIWFRIARYWGVKRLFLTKNIFLKLGMFPIVDHYYDPLFNYQKISIKSNASTSNLALDAQKQLGLIKQFSYAQELQKMPLHSASESTYYYKNGSFGSGDAELYYSIIRKFKPRKILEIGSGFSTRLALTAIQKNKETDLHYECSITCIEPYEMPWLEKLDVNLIRRKVEEMEVGLFSKLDDGDILFVDSSHIIRPGGDVVFLILHVLPQLKKGVWVHFHDIFTPSDYPKAWLKEEFRMWNEQYLLEAFLLNNPSFEVVAALNYLNSNHKQEMIDVFPVLAMDKDREPGSFWIRKID